MCNFFFYFYSVFSVAYFHILKTKKGYSSSFVPVVTKGTKLPKKDILLYKVIKFFLICREEFANRWIVRVLLYDVASHTTSEVLLLFWRRVKSI